ncbi:MAG: nicotinate-nucleotide adenylyltransferase [Thermicanus sp.]|nr:nicotinate-nucleotide adenylyltransferase [Thermicanus sp.]
MNSQIDRLRVGVLGGTFDPLHIGHLIAAERVFDELKLDEIWFLPSHIPPHKLDHPPTPAVHRVEMVRRAIAPYPEFHLCLVELEREGPSYTVDTMEQLRKEYPSYHFYFIMGADMVDYLPHWHRYEDLLAKVPIVALKRPGFTLPKHVTWADQITFVPMPQLDLSSSEIRRMRREGKSIRFLVPDVVEHYIEEKGLYVEQRGVTPEDERAGKGETV